MDFVRINEALKRGIRHFEETELDDLRAFAEQADQYMDLETGSAIDGANGDNAPASDAAETGADSGVENQGSAAQAFLSTISDMALAVLNQVDGLTDDQAMEYVLTAAASLAEKGDVPELPDMDNASDEDLSMWAGAAKTSNMGAMAVTLAQADKGES